MKYILLSICLIFSCTILAQTNNTGPEAAAATAIYLAQFSFAEEKYEIALNGLPETYSNARQLGFKDIILEHKGTKSANLAYYYAGICLLNLAEYQKAIDHFLKYDGHDTPILQATTFSLLADAYSELKNYTKAVSYYEKAGQHLEGSTISPYALKKAALVYEIFLKDKEKAKTILLEIQSKYPLLSSRLKIEQDLIRINLQ